MALSITSPGVQINEIDLSLRANLPAGTNVVVPGFAAQGPTSEPLLITTISELQSVYGTPTTAAERYFYYSCAEVLNSPGTLTTIRLPYGSDTGSDFATAYSGLFYPLYQNQTLTLSADTTNVIISATPAPGYTIGAPTHVTLSQADHDKIVQGNITWVSTDPAGYTTTYTTGSASAPTPGLSGNYFYSVSAPDLSGNVLVTQVQQSADSASFNSASATAGFFIINNLQTVINENAEGYYIGLANNTDPSTSGYNAITSIQTLSSADGFGSLSPNLYNNNTTYVSILTSSIEDSSVYSPSISESLQNVGFTGFYTTKYSDQISLGVYKLRRSTVDGTTIAISNVEKYIGTLDLTRKVNSPTGGALQSAFVEDVVNGKSKTIEVFVNPSSSQSTLWSSTNTEARTQISVDSSAKSLFALGVYTPNTSDVANSKAIGEVPNKLSKVLSLISSTENTTVDVVIDAGLSTIYATTQNNSSTNYDDTTYVDTVSSLNENWNAVADEFINFAQNQRRDCVAILDPLRQIFISGKDSKVINQTGSTFTVDIFNNLQSLINPINSNYTAIYGNWVKVNDLFSGRNVWVPFSGYAAAVFARNDSVAQPWYAPAGLNRGTFVAIDIAFNPNQKQRDKFYDIAVNPVANFSGNGFAIFGEKTLQGTPSAFDRINVRRLFLALERSTQRTLKYYVFEPNTNFTRTRLRNTLSPIFEYAKNSNGLYDYLIICDERNNTPSLIDQNQLVVDIYLKPVRTAEFINVNFIATTTAQNFQELI